MARASGAAAPASPPRYAPMSSTGMRPSAVDSVVSDARVMSCPHACREPSPYGLLVPRLELGELAHEGRGDLRVDLAVEKDGPVRLAQHRTEGAQLVQRANRVRPEPERLCDGREI